MDRNLARITKKYYPISSPYNTNRTINGVSRPHRAIDIATPVNTKIFSPVFGEVYSVGYNNRAGNYIKILDRRGNIHLFAHLNNILTTKGSKVFPAKLIALSGNTGNTTGAHLHYAITDDTGIKLDPENIYNQSFKNRYLAIGIATVSIVSISIVLLNRR